MEDKYVGIIASSNNNIDDYYVEVAKDIANYLAGCGYNLIFGGCSTSMMGACYDEFVDHERDIKAFTTSKYENDLVFLDKASCLVCDTTFELKKEIFNNSDIIVALPGGIGTYSELLSFIEEKRSNDKNIPIEIYDEDGYFLPFIETLKIMELKSFNDDSIYGLFNISHNMNEFMEHISSYQKEKENTK